MTNFLFELKTKCPYYEFVKKPLDENEAVAQLLAEIGNRSTRQLVGNHKMADLHQHVHGVAAK